MAVQQRILGQSPLKYPQTKKGSSRFWLKLMIRTAGWKTTVLMRQLLGSTKRSDLWLFKPNLQRCLKHEWRNLELRENKAPSKEGNFTYFLK
jgi:hypothetical protein